MGKRRTKNFPQPSTLESDSMSTATSATQSRGLALRNRFVHQPPRMGFPHVKDRAEEPNGDHAEAPNGIPVSKVKMGNGGIGAIHAVDEKKEDVPAVDQKKEVVLSSKHKHKALDEAFFNRFTPFAVRCTTLTREQRKQRPAGLECFHYIEDFYSVELMLMFASGWMIAAGLFHVAPFIDYREDPLFFPRPTFPSDPRVILFYKLGTAAAFVSGFFNVVIFAIMMGYSLGHLPSWLMGYATCQFSTQGMCKEGVFEIAYGRSLKAAAFTACVLNATLLVKPEWAFGTGLQSVWFLGFVFMFLNHRDVDDGHEAHLGVGRFARYYGFAWTRCGRR